MTCDMCGCDRRIVLVAGIFAVGIAVGVVVPPVIFPAASPSVCQCTVSNTTAYYMAYTAGYREGAASSGETTPGWSWDYTLPDVLEAVK